MALRPRPLLLLAAAGCVADDGRLAGGLGANRPPVFDVIAPMTVEVGRVSTLVVHAEDPDGDTVTYAFGADDPAGSTLHPRTGLFGWTPAPDAAGRFLRVGFVADDGRGGVDSMAVLLMVAPAGGGGSAAGEGEGEGEGDGTGDNRPPVFEPIDDRLVDVGQTVQIEVRVADPDPGDTVEVSIGGRTPLGAAWDAAGRLFRWTPRQADDGQTWQLWFAATDGQAVATEDVKLSVRKSRPDRPRPGPGGGDGGAGPDPGGGPPEACEDDAREAGAGDDDLERALPLSGDLGRDLRLCPGDPDHRFVELRVRQDARVTVTTDGALTVEVRGPQGLYAQGRADAGGASLELVPVPLSGRYWLSFHAQEPRTYRLELSLSEGGCPPGSFACMHGDDCVDADRVCDDRSDCPDSTDELGCGFECLSIEFQCGDGSCIPRSWRCDGSPDCVDGDDEQNCAFVCEPGQFPCPGEERCLPPDRVCDGQEDCAQGADEARCAQEPRCDPAYPDVCVPPFPPDLDCADLDDRAFRALPADPHGLDADGDGLACELEEDG